jgi:hypothetical protein
LWVGCQLPSGRFLMRYCSLQPVSIAQPCTQKLPGGVGRVSSRPGASSCGGSRKDHFAEGMYMRANNFTERVYSMRADPRTIDVVPAAAVRDECLLEVARPELVVPRRLAAAQTKFARGWPQSRAKFSRDSQPERGAKA